MQFWKIICVAYRMKFQFQLQFSFPFNFPMKICIQGNKRWNMLPKLPRTKPLDWVSVGCGSHKATLAIQSKPCLVLVMLSLWLRDNCPKKGPLSTMVAMHTQRESPRHKRSWNTFPFILPSTPKPAPFVFPLPIMTAHTRTAALTTAILPR